MKQSLQLKLGQHLTMTPQLQQAIRLLQLSTLELSTEIQDVLDSNLMLEVPEESADSPQEDFAENTSAAETQATDTEVPAQDNDINLESQEMPDELPVDSNWDDVYDSIPVTAAPGPEQEYDTQSSGDETLQDHLEWQLELTPFSDIDRLIAMSIIDDIDEIGFFRGSLEEIVNSIEHDPAITIEEAEAVLHRLQAFDPPGVAARDLQESLVIQLNQLNPDTPWRDTAIELVSNHMDLLGKKDFNELRKAARISREELQEVMQVIQSMNPRPGNQINSGTPEYIIPDVFVSRKNGQWVVELNQESLPKVRINPFYASLIKRADNSSDNVTMKNHLQEARWFLKSLQNRSDTLLRVANAIIERQKGFLDYGAEAMRPMVLHDIAEAVDMHESTISRVTTRKYMHTPRGIFELKYFFSSHVQTETGGEASSTAIRALIKKLVAAENPVKPLSDSKIASILSGEGIKVARRTVAKYREAMIIPSSTDRKRLA